MPVITLHTLAKNVSHYIAVKPFISENIIPEPIPQIIYFSDGVVSGTLVRYHEMDGTINKYLVSETVSQIGIMIDPPLNWGYSSGISGTVTISGNKKIKEITAVAQESSATIQINGGDIITLPYGSTDHLSVSLNTKPEDLIDPTIIFTSTKSYFIEYYQL